jgi:hypothetical protein
MAAWTLVLVPLPIAVTLHVVLPLSPTVDEAIFVAGAVAFAAGALVVLGRDDGDADEPPEDDADPPWWPEFERQLRIYSTTRPRRPERLARS